MDFARSLSRIATVLDGTGKTDEAVATYRQSESLLAGLAGADPSARTALAACRSLLGYLLSRTGKPVEALAVYNMARADQEVLAVATGASNDARRELDRVEHRTYVPVQVGDAVIVVDAAVSSDDVGERGAVLGDHQWCVQVVAMHALQQLAEAAIDGTRQQHIESLVTVPLLIIDDLGMRRLPLTAAEELLEIIMRRYERASTMITSNRPVDDWGKLLGDSAAVTAMLDRLLHHGHVLKCGPRSWRTKIGLPPQQAAG